ncbi:craniofacial development protein 2-like [Diabrotica virgifera virgifera]|uniref:Endonuclease/exonuclease/phosphatase domain-containing protein n=1 Tax=Diabrotica virgifera virgifera TaxID=50390 RepID=A0ABM5KVX2_DIAVI|nr:craniofacial development protein 2-like [Diabrotica virgifera virgifera]
MAQSKHNQSITDHGSRKPRSGREGCAPDCGAFPVVTTRNPYNLKSTTTLKMSSSTIRLGTWNVKSLYAAGKLSNLVQEVKRLKIDIMGISELRWPGAGTCEQNEGTLYYSGSVEDDVHHRNGVGIFITSKFKKYVKNFVPVNDRLAILQLNSKPFNVNVIQIYAPTSEKKYDNDVESFYSQLKQTLNNLNRNEITYIIGDFNAKIDQGRRSDLIGGYGLGESNERGDRLYQFCQEHDMIIANTWFKLHKRRLYTWKGPGDNSLHIIRNQIDYILVNKRFKNGVKRSTTYPGADIGSDHNLLIADIQVKLKKVEENPKTPKLHISASNKTLIENDLNNQLKNSTNENNTEIWNTFKNLTWKVMEKYTTTMQRHKKQQWMTDEILELMEQRRKLKDNKTKYKEKQKLIKQKIKVAKEKWMEDKCKELEKLNEKDDTFNMFKKVREVAGLYYKKTPHTITDSSGKMIIDEHEIRTTWYNYINELYNDDRPEELDTLDEGEGPEILKSEIQHAIKLAKTRKPLVPTTYLQKC